MTHSCKKCITIYEQLNKQYEDILVENKQLKEKVSLLSIWHKNGNKLNPNILSTHEDLYKIELSNIKETLKTTIEEKDKITYNLQIADEELKELRTQVEQLNISKKNMMKELENCERIIRVQSDELDLWEKSSTSTTYKNKEQLESISL